MSDDKKTAPKPEEKMPGDATPHNPGLSPKPSDAAGDGEASDGAPYEKDPEPAQQPS